MNTRIPMIAAALVAIAATAGSAEARDGCGPGGHRGPWGHCRPNGGPGVVVAPGGWVVDRYYPGRGYWDGHGWRHHRRHGPEGWRYW